MSKELLITVIVAVNADARIYRLLESLLCQTVQDDKFEIIVVENGSRGFANVVAMGRGLVRYMHSQIPNMAEARNIGLKAAKGRYLLVTDADVVAHPDWIFRMIERLEEGRYAAVGGRIGKLEVENWIQQHAITIVDGQMTLNYLPALSLPYVVGANSGFVTAAVREVGGFDAKFKSGNDVDLCYRLGLRGYQIGLAPAALVLHEDRSTLWAHFRRFRTYAVYQVLLFAKYRESSGRRFVINPYPFRRVVGAIASTPRIIIGLTKGDIGPAARALLQCVEAAGVWCGDIEGSIRYRQLYL